MKRTVPIVFAFDNNLILPAKVCLSSLMMSASENTYYDIFILHSTDEVLDTSDLDAIPESFPNCRITYRTVDGFFNNAFEIRGITTPAYYRLLIPDLIPEYDKVIYSDVDVIFRMDLSSLYQSCLDGYCIAATLDLGMNLSKDGQEHISKLPGVQQGCYIQSGFLIINNVLIREKGLVEIFKETAKQKFQFQDQDILNIVCSGMIQYLPLEYNMTDYSFYYVTLEKDLMCKMFSDESVSNALNFGTLHYNGHKPWKKYCVNFDIWWETYRRSPFFDQRLYFDFFYSKLDELDQLSLWKRIKLLLRYFVVRK